jgi:hypothetical protein
MHLANICLHCCAVCAIVGRVESVKGVQVVFGGVNLHTFSLMWWRHVLLLIHVALYSQ